MADKTQAQFDPDAYLAQAGGEFDPDKYLAAQGTPEQIAGKPRFETPQAFSSANYMTAGYAANPEAQGEAVKGFVQYGLPALAAVGTAGMSVPAMAAASSLTSGASNVLGQLLEKGGDISKVSGREAAAATIAGAAVPVPLKPVAGEVVPLAKAALNFATNVGISAGAGEAARAIEKGGFEKPEGLTDYALRVGLPVGLSAIGTYAGVKAARASEAAYRSENILSERGSKGMLGEVSPEYASLEAKQYQKGNPLAVNLANDMSTSVDQHVVNLVKDAPNASEVARRLMLRPEVADLESLRVKAVNARRAANELEQQASVMAQSDAREANLLYQKANEAGVQAVKEKALMFDAAQKLLGDDFNNISKFAAGERINRVQELAAAAKESVKAGLTKLYERAGIGVNDPVASLEFVVRRLGRSIESDPDRNEVIKMIEQSIKATKGMTDDRGNLTLAGFRRIRDDIAAGLVKEGRDVKYANRVAGQAYDAVTKAMEDTLASIKTDDASLMTRYLSSGAMDQGIPFSQYRESIRIPDASAYKEANRVAAAIYSARDAEIGAVDMINSGRIDDLVKLIEREGYGPVAKNIQSYASALRSVGDDASIAAARQFVSDTHLAIRDHLISTSLRLGEGVDDASKIIDVPALIKRIDSLRQKKISPEALGFGSEDTIKAMARVAANSGGSMNAEQFGQFMRDVESMGSKGAEATQLYSDTYRKFLAAQGVDEKRALSEKLQRQLRETKFKADVLERVTAEAQNDPLVRLFNEPGLGISPNPTSNTNYVTRVLDSGPVTVTKLVKTLQQGVQGNAEQNMNRLATLEMLKKSAVADVLGETLNRAMGPNGQKADLSKITDFFYSPSQKTRRESFAALVGDKEFSNLENLVGKPAASILARFKQLEGPIPSIKNQLIVASGLIGQAQGRSTGGMIQGTLYDRFLNFIQEHQYNKLYALYVDPELSAQYRKNLGDINKFVNASTRNAVLYQMLNDSDSKTKRSQPTP